MKPSLQLGVSQSLAMTPQLQQAIRLLQLSTLDLQQEIQAALDSNPLLEMDDDGDIGADEAILDEGPDPLKLLEQQAQATAAGEVGGEDSPADTQAMDLDAAASMPDDLPVDSAWDDVFDSSWSASSGGSGGDEDGEFDTNGTRESLADRLLWQLNLTPMSDLDRAIAFAIIECIDPDGYLTVPLTEIRDAVLADEDMYARVHARALEPGEEPLELDEIEAVLHRVQGFEPAGIAARDLRECLLIQLRQLPETTRWRTEALRLVGDHLDLLGARDFALLGRRLGLDEERLAQVIRLIRSLNPRPGGSVAADDTGYVVPDVIVRREGRRWKVELNPDAAPRLRINAGYAAMARETGNRRDAEYLRNQLHEARWLLKSLRARNETLVKVATRIIEVQQGFLDHGPEAMKPLVLADVATAVGMHESTISRVTTEKYMLTPRGIFELKYFFSSHVGTAGGGECSSTAIRAIIRKLVAAENPRKPLSDNQIADMLVEQGINVARRTIAKYRESLNILSSSERKRLV
ncbi:MAG: RNA polymerase factor sigma-54 [Gammaproteobacteria bacterium]